MSDITDFIHKFKTTGKIELPTNGQEVRQFLHADDCGRCLVALAENFEEISKTRRHVDVSSHEWIKVLDLARMITPNSFVRSFSDPNTLREDPDRFMLNYWKPQITLKEGVDLMIDEYDRRQNTQR
jgi:nucleoside-diphosphate-sugar epimerase